MATTVITGRDVGLSFTGGTDIQAQATNAVLTKVNDRQVYQTMDGEAYKTVNVSGTFQLDMLADWAKQGQFVRLYGLLLKPHQIQTSA